jgi:hypothetical protein
LEEKMDMISNIPEITLTGQNINKKILKNSIKLWTSPEKGGTSCIIIIPKEIKTDNKFWIGIGLFLADGTKPGIKNKDKGRIAFTNGDAKQILIMLEFFEHFGLNRKMWKGIISANSYYIPDVNEFRSRSIEYWSKNTGIPSENISAYFYNRKPKKIRETLKFGTIQIRYGNIILNSILWNIINNN